MTETRRSHDRSVHSLLVEVPRERNLGHRDPLLVREFLDTGVDLTPAPFSVDLVSSTLPLRLVSPSRCRFEFVVGAGQISPGQRTLGDDADPLVLTQREHLPLFFAIDEGVMVLHRGEAIKAMYIRGVECLGELVRPHRRRPNVADASTSDRVGQRSERLLDWSVIIPAMDLIQIESIHPESLKTVVLALSLILPDGERLQLRSPNRG